MEDSRRTKDPSPTKTSEKERSVPRDDAQYSEKELIELEQDKVELPEEVIESIEKLELAEDKKEKVIQLFEFYQSSFEHKVSQFPFPEDLERYAQLFSDAPRIIFEGFKDQVNSRTSAIKKALEINELKVKGKLGLNVRGQWMAFTSLLIILSVIIFLSLNGAKDVAISLVTATAVIIGVFVFTGTGKRKNNNKSDH